MLKMLKIIFLPLETMQIPIIKTWRRLLDSYGKNSKNEKKFPKLEKKFKNLYKFACFEYQKI